MKLYSGPNFTFQKHLTSMWARACVCDILQIYISKLFWSVQRSCFKCVCYVSLKGRMTVSRELETTGNKLCQVYVC